MMVLALAMQLYQSFKIALKSRAHSETQDKFGRKTLKLYAPEDMKIHGGWMTNYTQIIQESFQ